MDNISSTLTGMPVGVRRFIIIGAALLVSAVAVGLIRGRS